MGQNGYFFIHLKGMEDFPIQVTVKVEGDECLEKKMEQEVVDSTRNEDSDLGEEGMYISGDIEGISMYSLSNILWLLVLKNKISAGF